MFPRFVRRDVIVLLLLKAAALTVLYFVFISPHTTAEPGARATAQHIFGN